MMDNQLSSSRSQNAGEQEFVPGCVFCNENSHDYTVFCPTPFGQRAHSACYMKVLHVANGTFERLNEYFISKGITSARVQNTYFSALYQRASNQMGSVKPIVYLKNHGKEAFQQAFRAALQALKSSLG
jgi:hypothetical protein